MCKIIYVQSNWMILILFWLRKEICIIIEKLVDSDLERFKEEIDVLKNVNMLIQNDIVSGIIDSIVRASKGLMKLNKCKLFSCF